MTSTAATSTFTITAIPINFTTWTAGTIVTTVCSKDGDFYKYGFNGKLKDNEWAGIGNSEDFGARNYDSRIARFRSIDPLTKKYPEFSPYVFAANSPIKYIDVDGLGPGDRIKKALTFIGTKYSQKPNLNQGTELRTGNSAAALAYIDCSELVCRVMAADDITKNVKQYATRDLVKFLGNEDKFERSLDAPQAGDIFLWYDKTDKEGNPLAHPHGHTGIVQSVDKDGTIHTLEAYGTKAGTIKYARKLSGFTKHSGFQGFFRP